MKVKTFCSKENGRVVVVYRRGRVNCYNPVTKASYHRLQELSRRDKIQMIYYPNVG